MACCGRLQLRADTRKQKNAFAHEQTSITQLMCISHHGRMTE